jgi:hypothetical protein
MLHNIMAGSSSKERKSRLLESISNLDHFESAMLHRMVQYLTAHKVTRDNEYEENVSFFLPNLVQIIGR